MTDATNEQIQMLEADDAKAIVSAFKRDMSRLMNNTAEGLIKTKKELYERIEKIHARHWRDLAAAEGHCSKFPRVANNNFSLEVQAFNMRNKIRDDEGVTVREIKRRMALTPTEFDARLDWLLRNDGRESGAYIVVEGKGGTAKLFTSYKAQAKYHADLAQARLDLRREISLSRLDDFKNSE